MVNFPRLLEVLTLAWDTQGGQALRSLIWSIYNDRVAVPLWSALTDLDESTRRELCKVLMLDMDSRSAVIGGILHASGEWDRIDTVPLKWSVAAEG
jgi:hypothetical protein